MVSKVRIKAWSCGKQGRALRNFNVAAWFMVAVVREGMPEIPSVHSAVCDTEFMVDPRQRRDAREVGYWITSTGRTSSQQHHAWDPITSSSATP
jgi:hypothetical protein